MYDKKVIWFALVILHVSLIIQARDPYAALSCVWLCVDEK